jgi:hypothetical protein
MVQYTREQEKGQCLRHKCLGTGDDHPDQSLADGSRFLRHRTARNRGPSCRHQSSSGKTRQRSETGVRFPLGAFPSGA